MCFIVRRGNSPLPKDLSKPGREASKLLRRLHLGSASVDCKHIPDPLGILKRTLVVTEAALRKFSECFVRCQLGNKGGQGWGAKGKENNDASSAKLAQ